jgi:hypothetical protein
MLQFAVVGCFVVRGGRTLEVMLFVVRADHPPAFEPV